MQPIENRFCILLMKDTENNGKPQGRWTPEFTESLQELIKDANESGKTAHHIQSMDNNNDTLHVIIISKHQLDKPQLAKFSDLCYKTGKELPHTDDSVTLRTLKSHDTPQTGSIDYAGTTAEAVRKGIEITVNEKDMVFVRNLLPSSYKITNTRNGIRCQSNKGIAEGWNMVFDALKNHFGMRFMEVYHITNYNHVDFIVFLSSDEALIAARDMAHKAAKSTFSLDIVPEPKTSMHAELSKIVEVPAPGSPEDLQIQEDIAFVKNVLPAHYTILKSTYGDIRCLSDFGVDSPTEWKRVMKVLEDHFGTKLHDIDHKTNFQHVDFMIHLKPKRHMEPAPKEKIYVPMTDIEFIGGLLPNYHVEEDTEGNILCTIAEDAKGGPLTSDDDIEDFGSLEDVIRFRFGFAFVSIQPLGDVMDSGFKIILKQK